jgi:hypothetical protein
VGARLGGIGNETGTAGELRGDEGTPPAEARELVPAGKAATDMAPPHLPQNSEPRSFWAPHCWQNIISPESVVIGGHYAAKLSFRRALKLLECFFVVHQQVSGDFHSYFVFHKTNAGNKPLSHGHMNGFAFRGSHLWEAC